MLKKRYGCPESVAFTEQVARDMAVAGWEAALELAQEKGAAPIMDETSTSPPRCCASARKWQPTATRSATRIQGESCTPSYSRYMQRIAKVAPELVDELAETGARFTHHSSIAPTGTISLSLANNASNGIEPASRTTTSRNVIREGKKSKEKVDVFSLRAARLPRAGQRQGDAVSRRRRGQAARLLRRRRRHQPEAARRHPGRRAEMGRLLHLQDRERAHGLPLRGLQGHLPYAHEQGLKGCTTFRFNPAAFQGVLVKEADLENTTYRFELEDGSVVEAKGNEEIEYDGEMHTAANLFDALEGRLLRQILSPCRSRNAEDGS